MIRKQENCPRFNLTRKQSETIILPSGVTREISLPVQNLAFGNVLFGCIISVEGKQTYVNGRIEQTNIICSASKYSYENENSTGIATVTAVWNKINYIDQVNG